MSTDMAFKCLLVSRDPGVVGPMNNVLESFSISTDVCLTSYKAADRLSEASADLVIVDWEEGAADLVDRIKNAEARRKPTVVAVSISDQAIAGADLVLRKPVTRESCTRSVKDAYTRMMRDHRRYARYAVMVRVTAEDQNHRSLAVTVMDIGDGGVGLMTRERLAVGDLLSFSLLLPGALRPIHIEARVLWTKQYGAAGCSFVHIPAFDLTVLYDWLKLNCKIKPLAIEL